MTSVTINKRDFNLAGLLFKPSKPSSDKSPAIIVVHPGGGVKEQTASIYSRRFAELGYVTLTFDASYQGESGGKPHFLEDPEARTTDVNAAVDYLENLNEVDSNRIAVFGICAGGGYSVCAAKTDYRIKAVATASMVNIGDGFRRGWYGKDDPAKQVDTLKFIAQSIQAENGGKQPEYLPYVPEKPDKDTPPDMAEASDYYRTPRAQHPRSENKMSMRSPPLISRFDAFHLVETFLQAPLLVIAGDKAGSAWHSTELAERLGSKRAQQLIVPGATHMDFYDQPGPVEKAVSAADAFFKSTFGL
ncbi:X-Pro dipeptidyl-peptidase protein [Meira miltonrushii]|uniref:X-Pro dipeptidyl-peptidase protein n=1 Tax=Meira miltonrushii TaxID=1280837 RepID=A0A316VBP1_9BASI|nr:X-Pro dipeptidyl-peptidase protein [Meira miltonrushii]PWN33673.1 X-Pro dipeptidyl-peptidase protein [Meira miltonrushii]